MERVCICSIVLGEWRKREGGRGGAFRGCLQAAAISPSSIHAKIRIPSGHDVVAVRVHHRCHRTDTARTKAAATWPRSRRGRHSPPDTFSPISTSLSTSNFRLWIEGLITGVTNVLLYWVIGCSTTVLRILRLFPDTSQTHAHSLAALKCQPRLLVARSRSWPSAPTLVA